MSRYIKVVLAAVILVVVGITVSVAYWMSGIAPLWVAIEGIGISNVSVARGVFSGNYSTIFSVKNTGNVDALIDMIYINGIPYDNKSFTDKIYMLENPLAHGCHLDHSTYSSKLATRN